MPRRVCWWRSAVVPGAALLAVALSACAELGRKVHDLCDRCDHCDPGAVCQTPTVMALAEDLDCLEGHIDRYGSVVVKQADVWGQARQTRHREEFEKILGAQKDLFTAHLQGSLTRSDNAYFFNALALSNAASGIETQAPTGGKPLEIPKSTGVATDIASLDPTIRLDEHARYLQHL